MKENQQLQLLMQRIESAELHRKSKYEDQWRDFYRRFRFRPERPREGSNLFVPYSFMLCAVIQARLATSLFVTRPYITALPREDTDSEQAALVQQLIDWQLNDRMEIARVVGEEALQSLVVYGTAVTYTGWRFETRQVKQTELVPVPLAGPDGMPLVDELGQIITIPERQVVTATRTIYDDPVV